MGNGVDEGGGVIKTPRAELIYLEEIKAQSGHGLWTLDRLRARSSEWVAANSVLEDLDSEGDSYHEAFRSLVAAQDELFDRVQAFLTSWARVSLLFFPARGGDKQRGEHLRRILQLPADHSISDRELRNEWMHLDERLDRVIGEVGVVSLQYFRSSKDLPRPHTPMRCFVVDTLRVEMLGRVFDLTAMAADLRDVYERQEQARTPEALRVRWKRYYASLSDKR